MDSAEQHAVKNYTLGAKPNASRLRFDGQGYASLEGVCTGGKCKPGVWTYWLDGGQAEDRPPLMGLDKALMFVL